MKILHAALLGSGVMVIPVVVSAQGPAPDAVTPPAAVAAPLPIDCESKAAVYQGAKGLKLWVLRRGTMVLAENPLRPLSRDEAVVLDVVVNGRRATAVGPDVVNQRQGGSPKAVEREGREPIRWAESGLPPPALRVVAEDGHVLLGPMPFGGCEDPPTAKAVVDKPVKAERADAPKRKGSRGAAAGADPLPGHLPQGALQGLSLPKDGTRR